ncbi:hypothetical protein ACFLV7_14535 [Chloroflexota bacterium]
MHFCLPNGWLHPPRGYGEVTFNRKLLESAQYRRLYARKRDRVEAVLDRTPIARS